MNEKDKQFVAAINNTSNTTTATLKNNIEWVDSTSSAMYRANKLDKYVNVNKNENDKNVYSLTEAGIKIGKEVGEHEPVELRLKRMEAKIQKNKEFLHAQHEVIKEYERIFDDLGVNVDRVGLMKDALNK